MAIAFRKASPLRLGSFIQVLRNGRRRGGSSTPPNALGQVLVQKKVVLPTEWHAAVQEAQLDDRAKWALNPEIQAGLKEIQRIAREAGLDPHIQIPKSAVVGVLDVVRNNVLKFALEIEERNPAAGDGSPGTKPVPESWRPGGRGRRSLAFV